MKGIHLDNRDYYAEAARHEREKEREPQPEKEPGRVKPYKPVTVGRWRSDGAGCVERMSAVEMALMEDEWE